MSRLCPTTLQKSPAPVISLKLTRNRNGRNIIPRQFRLLLVKIMASLSSSDVGSSISSSPSFRRGSRGLGSSLAWELSVQVDDAVNKSNKDRLKRTKSDVPLARPLLTGLQLHGREEDLRVVSGVVEGVFSADEATEKPLLMVAGSSGCGKSALVTKGIRDLAKRRGIIFCGGKFDQNKNAIPFSAVAQALAELADHVLTSKHADAIKTNIKKELGGDVMHLIGSIAPGCWDLFGTTPNTVQAPGVLGGGMSAVSRLQFAIGRLVKIICTRLKVVMFIDDLQWADESSLNLCLSLQTDKDIHNLLLVGAYRDDEVSDDHPVTLRITEAEKMGTLLTTIKLGNLERGAVQSLVAESLRMEDDKDRVDSLAAIVHKKTGGNPFFVLLFLRSIYDEELLEYNLSTLSWNWDDELVKNKYATDNVTSILLNKLQRLEPSAQTIIKVASCLGEQFSKDGLLTAVTELLSDSSSERTSSGSLIFTVDELSSIDSALVEFEREGLWESDDGMNYRFAHDQIQMAAAKLIQDEEQANLKGEIGRILLSKLDQEKIEESLFVITSLRNHAGTSLNEGELLDLAKLNANAGFKASENAAFDSAVVYFEVSRMLFGSKGWDSNQELMVRLYTEEVQARHVVGDLAVMDSLAEELLGKKELPIIDKFQVYNIILTASSLRVDRQKEGFNTALNVLKLLHYRSLPTKVSAANIFIEYMKVSHEIKGLSTDSILSLPELTDERIIMVQNMLHLLARLSYGVEPKLFPILCCRMVRESVKHGLNENSPNAFCSFAVLLSGGFGNFQRGKQMGQVAESLVERPGLGRWKSLVAYMLQSMVYHWTKPLQSTLTPLLSGYRTGLESGDLESAGINLFLYVQLKFFCSHPMDEVLHQARVAMDVFMRLKQDHPAEVALPMLQAMINLQGNAARPWELSGEEMAFEELENVALENDKPTLRGHLYFFQLELLVLFQEWDTARRFLPKAVKARELLFGSFQVVRSTFFEGLTCLKSARMTKSWANQWRLKSKARKSMKILRGWAKKGNPNVVHLVHLLEAESSSLRGKVEAAEEGYKSAIKVATRCGFVQDKALAHELAGKYYLDKGDEYWAKYHLSKAYETFLDWKATAKAADLARKYPQFISDEE